MRRPRPWVRDKKRKRRRTRKKRKKQQKKKHSQKQKGRTKKKKILLTDKNFSIFFLFLIFLVLCCDFLVFLFFCLLLVLFFLLFFGVGFPAFFFCVVHLASFSNFLFFGVQVCGFSLFMAFFSRKLQTNEWRKEGKERISEQWDRKRLKRGRIKKGNNRTLRFVTAVGPKTETMSSNQRKTLKTPSAPPSSCSLATCSKLSRRSAICACSHAGTSEAQPGASGQKSAQHTPRLHIGHAAKSEQRRKHVTHITSVST